MKNIDFFFSVDKGKRYADDKIKMTEKLKFVLGRVENIVGKAENLVSSIFFLFCNVLKDLFFTVMKSQDCVVKG